MQLKHFAALESVNLSITKLATVRFNYSLYIKHKVTDVISCNIYNKIIYFVVNSISCASALSLVFFAIVLAFST